MPHGVAAPAAPGRLSRRGLRATFRRRPLPRAAARGGTLVAEARFAAGHGWNSALQLHLALARRAEQAGVELHWGEAVRDRPEAS